MGCKKHRRSPATQIMGNDQPLRGDGTRIERCGTRHFDDPAARDSLSWVTTWL
jgi:hypothetical protein